MHDEIGIAPDRRGEVGVARQGETEMPEIVWAVDGLGLGSQHQLVDHRDLRPSGRARQDAVEQLRPDDLALCQGKAGNPQLVEEIAQGRQLFRVGLVMHAVEAGLTPRFELLGGGDVGEDHEFFDQPVAVEPGARDDRDRAPVAVEHDPVLGEVERQRAARLSHPIERREGTIECRQPFRGEREGVALAPVMRRLDRIVGQPGRRAHDRALKAVPPLMPGGVDPQVHGEARPVGAWYQRAQIVGQRLRQHRHDAVGEIDRVATAERLAVERAAGGDIGADIGNRDDGVPAAGIGRIRIGLGPHRIVEITRVAVVDRDQCQPAQIGAAGRISRPRGGGLGERGGRKLGGDLERGDRHPADRPRRIRRAEAVEDAAAFAEAARRQFLGDYQLVIGKPGRVMAEHPVLALVPAVDGDDFAAIARPVEDTDDAVRCLVEAADDFSLDLARAAADQPRQRALAWCELFAGCANQAKVRRLATCRPGNRPG